MPMVRISPKGQIVIPKDIRERLGIKSNGRVYVEIIGDHAEIRKAPDLIKELRGILKDVPSTLKALLEEHKKEVEENEKLSP